MVPRTWSGAGCQRWVLVFHPGLALVNASSEELATDLTPHYPQPPSSHRIPSAHPNVFLSGLESAVATRAPVCRVSGSHSAVSTSKPCGAHRFPEEPGCREGLAPPRLMSGAPRWPDASLRPHSAEDCRQKGTAGSVPKEGDSDSRAAWEDGRNQKEPSESGAQCSQGLRASSRGVSAQPI